MSPATNKSNPQSNPRNSKQLALPSTLRQLPSSAHLYDQPEPRLVHGPSYHHPIGYHTRRCTLSSLRSRTPQHALAHNLDSSNLVTLRNAVARIIGYHCHISARGKKLYVEVKDDDGPVRRRRCNGTSIKSTFHQAVTGARPDITVLAYSKSNSKTTSKPTVKDLGPVLAIDIKQPTTSQHHLDRKIRAYSAMPMEEVLVLDLGDERKKRYSCVWVGSPRPVNHNGQRNYEWSRFTGSAQPNMKTMPLQCRADELLTFSRALRLAVNPLIYMSRYCDYLNEIRNGQRKGAAGHSQS